MLNKKMGNIREMNFDKLWLSRKAQEIRGFIKEKNVHAGHLVKPILLLREKI